MGFANFTQRAMDAASQVLQGFDPERFMSTLESHSVGLAFGASVTESPEARITLDLAVNLLARLYPRIAIIAIENAAQDITNELAALAQEINPEIEILSSASDVDVCLVIGQEPIETRAPVYLGSNGWVAKVSPAQPVGSGATRNPFGAAAAACFGAANVFRSVFGEQLAGARIDNTFSLSLLDFQPNLDDPENLALGTVDMGEVQLVGVGAIGNAAVWTLARVPGLRGTLDLIDDETVDLGNLQRYVLTRQADRDKPKVALAADHLQHTDLNVRPHAKTWAAFLKDRGGWTFQRVALALDTPLDRVAVQAALPRWIVNSWTQAGDLGVSRHDFLGEGACVACLYLPDGKQSDLSQIVADAIGLPAEKQQVGHYLHTNAPVHRDFLERIAKSKGLPLDRLLPFEGKPLRVFYSAAVCGGAVLQFNDRNGQATRTEVPMAFQSAMAGVLLASELVAHAGRIRRQAPATITTMDLLRPLGKYLSLPRKKDRERRCICQDEDYIAAYTSKYVRSA